MPFVKCEYETVYQSAKKLYEFKLRLLKLSSRAKKESRRASRNGQDLGLNTKVYQLMREIQLTCKNLIGAKSLNSQEKLIQSLIFESKFRLDDDKPETDVPRELSEICKELTPFIIIFEKHQLQKKLLEINKKIQILTVCISPFDAKEEKVKIQIKKIKTQIKEGRSEINRIIRMIKAHGRISARYNSLITQLNATHSLT